MAVRDDVVVGQDVRAQLGGALDNVLASLWALDCQSCNRPLAGRRPAQSVDDMVSWASASLHHEKCRPSRWNDDSVVPMSPDSTLSHRTMCILLPLMIGNATEPELKPLLVVNPGLEQVFLDHSPLGQWKVVPNAAFAAAGLKPPPVAMESPVTGVSAELRANTLTVVFAPGMVGPYASSLNEQARSLVPGRRRPDTRGHPRNRPAQCHPRRRPGTGAARRPNPHGLGQTRPSHPLSVSAARPDLGGAGARPAAGPGPGDHPPPARRWSTCQPNAETLSSLRSYPRPSGSSSCASRSRPSSSCCHPPVLSRRRAGRSERERSARPRTRSAS
jgi:hypothetical protein